MAGNSGVARLAAGARLQAKLAVNRPGDAFEQEADRVADRVMRTPEPMVHRECACGGTCEGCQEEEPPTLQRESDGGLVSAPPAVPEVLRAEGEPLDPGTRAFMEPRLGADLGGVRVHRDAAAADSARAFKARAFTLGRHVVFGHGEYRPSTPDGRRLLAHELTHFMQQTAGLAPPGHPQFERRLIAGREFEVGDVRLEGMAPRDVRRFGVLLPGPDQTRIAVTSDGRLAYEVAHTDPADPYRWENLRRIIDEGALTIRGVRLTEPFSVKEVVRGQERVVTRSLGVLGLAGGITLPRLALQRAIHPNAPVVVASADDSRDTIFYDAGGAGGRGTLGTNSLAHELFGHLVLARRRAPFQHGEQLTAADRVVDPFGRPFVGSVNDFIDRFAGARNAALQSPTQNVGFSHIQAAMTFIMNSGAAELDVNSPTGGASDAFGLRWEILSRNYVMLRQGSTPPARPTVDSPEGIVTWVVGWERDLTDPQRNAFRGFLRAVESRGGFTGSHSTRLASDVLARLSARSTP